MNYPWNPVGSLRCCFKELVVLSSGILFFHREAAEYKRDEGEKMIDAIFIRIKLTRRGYRRELTSVFLSMDAEIPRAPLYYVRDEFLISETSSRNAFFFSLRENVDRSPEEETLESVKRRANFSFRPGPRLKRIDPRSDRKNAIFQCPVA